jgi:hypothetical protein
MEIFITSKIKAEQRGRIFKRIKTKKNTCIHKQIKEMFSNQSMAIYGKTTPTKHIALGR